MAEWFPPSDWLNEVEDSIGSFNLWLTEVWLMDEDELEENRSWCDLSEGAVFRCRSVVFSLTVSLSHEGVQLACVVLSWVGGSAVTGSFIGTVEEDAMSSSSSRQRR